MTQNVKQLSLLTSPLNKIQDATEATTVILNKIAEVVLNGASSKSGDNTSDELKKQTTILTDIRSILREQNKMLAKGAGAKGGPSGGMFTPMSAKDVGLTALMMIGIAGAIVGAAAIFTFIPTITGPQFLTALAVTAIFVLVAGVFVKIAETLSGQKDLAASTGADLNSPKKMYAMAGATTRAMIGIAISILITAAIFTMMPKVDGIKLLTALAVAVIMIPAAFAYSMILKASKGLTTEQLIFAAVSIPLMALGIVGAAFAFKLLPEGKDLKAPDPIWVLKSALAIGLFAVGFYFIMKAIKGASLKNIIFGAFAIPVIALSIALLAQIFKLLPNEADLRAPDPIWTLKSALAIGLYAVGFYFIMKAIKGASLRDIVFGAIAIPIIAIGIVLTSLIFMALPKGDNLQSPDPMWTLKAGFAMLIFAIPFYIISKAIKGMSLKEMLFMVVAIPIIAFGVLATAWIFQGLAGISFEAPEYAWSFKAAVAIVLFGAMMYLSSKTIGKLSTGDMLKALLGVVVASFAIIAVAHLFTMLDGVNFIAPPMEWTIAAAAAITAFGAVIAGVGFAIEKMGPEALLYGALGIIVIAIVIVAVGWILSLLEGAMPALKTVASGFVDIIMMPVNAIITAFARFKDEIGIENMIPLAIGVAALGGAWLIFSAAVAGGDVAGLIGSAAGAVGAIFDGITSLFGGDTPSPLDILKELASIAPKIQLLAKPLTDVGVGFALINKSAGGVSKAFESVTKFVSDTDAGDLEKDAKSLSSIASSYTKISTASRTLNIKAIETTTNMFKALTDLAKNNGESAMSVLADKLLVAVKELTEAAGNLEDSVAKQGEATSGIGDVVSGAIATVKETVTGVKKDVSKMTADAKGVMDIQPLIDAITKLEERFDSFITVKIKPE